MRAFLMICVFVVTRFAAADVSHLNTRYLPPTMMAHGRNEHFHIQMHDNHSSNGKTTTTIEKQILQELPEQIEYAQPAQFASDDMMMMHDNVMMAMPAVEMLPPPVDVPSAMQNLPPIQSAQKVLAKMPAENYLPPLQHEAMQKDFQLPMLEMPAVEPQQMMESPAVEPEPAPAHMLTPDGYRYKTSSSFPTPMACAAMNRRFR